MKNLYLDTTTGDLEVYSNNFRFTANDTEFVSQKADSLFKTWKGEYWLNIDLGIPYLDKDDKRDITKNILGVSADLNVVKAIFLKELKSISQIKKILKLELLKDDVNKILTIDWTVSISDSNILSRSSIL